MKRFISLTAMFITLSGVWAQPALNKTAAMYGFKGKVKSVYGSRLLHPTEKFDDPVRENFLVRFDVDGNLTEEIRYHADGRVRERDTHKYDGRGNEIEWNKYNSSDNLIHTSVYKYDVKGYLTEHHGHSFDGSPSYKFTFTSTFDGAGNRIEMKCYSHTPDGQTKPGYTIKYDAAGNKTEEHLYTSDGRLEPRYTWQYNAAGKLIERIDYSPDGSIEYRETYTYDDKGNETAITAYRSGHLSYIAEYKYDIRGNRTEETGTHADGGFAGKTARTTYTYDDSGNRIETIFHDTTGQISRKYTYRYDRDGNCTEQISHTPGKRETVTKSTERTIEYYE